MDQKSLPENPPQEDLGTIPPAGPPSKINIDHIRERSRFWVFLCILIAILLLEAGAAYMKPTATDFLGNLINTSVNDLLVLLGTATGFYFGGNRAKKNK